MLKAFSPLWVHKYGAEVSPVGFDPVTLAAIRQHPFSVRVGLESHSNTHAVQKALGCLDESALQIAAAGNENISHKKKIGI